MNIVIPKPVNEVLNIINEKGYEAYLVGGAVRNMVMQEKPKNYNIVTDASIEEVQKILDQIYGEGVWTIIHYEGNNKPCKLQHKCGEFKTLTLAKNIRNGKLLCTCDPVPKGLQESYERNTVKKEDFQKEVNLVEIQKTLSQIQTDLERIKINLNSKK